MRLLDRYAAHHEREPFTEDAPTSWSSRDPDDPPFEEPENRRFVRRFVGCLPTFRAG